MKITLEANKKRIRRCLDRGVNNEADRSFPIYGLKSQVKESEF